jgi:hydroxyethylthiazole kinase-like uncharacterized protein yjeF
MTGISNLLFTAAEVRAMDRRVIDQQVVAGYTLMTRAGEAAFAAARARWPGHQRWLILCGAGNNAGDGYVIARLARAAGFDVTVMSIGDPQRLAGDAAKAWQDFRSAGGMTVAFDREACRDAGLIVDALLGTGLDRPVAGDYLACIEAVNRAARPVLAVDIPSGLCADRGQPLGAAVRADLTVTFVGRKLGLYLGAASDYVGKIVFSDLDIPEVALGELRPSLRLYEPEALAAVLPRRPANAHKGSFGHVLVIGGNHGMAGAVRLAGEAALRAGAGLVSVGTRPEHVQAIAGCRPELMCLGVNEPSDLDPVLARASVIALGPGLGRDAWARNLFARVLAAGQPKILDADALNLLAESPAHRSDWVLTPHPGEAARLLGVDTAAVQGDRLAALEALVARFGGVTVLKGHGSLIGGHDALPWLVDAGNPGMATAGMGDVLTGVAAGLLAQAPAQPLAAAAAAAYVHACAGDRAARGGERGLIASDVIRELRACLQPGS